MGAGDDEGRGRDGPDRLSARQVQQVRRLAADRDVMKSRPVETSRRAVGGIVVLTIVVVLALYGLACGGEEPDHLDNPDNVPATVTPRTD